MNNKFVYVEHRITDEINQLVRKIIYHQCLLRRAELVLAQAVGYETPEMFGYVYTGKQGIASARLGEVVHMTNCVPVNVRARSSKFCYDAQPIIHNDMELFLTPITKLIVKHAPQIICSVISPPMFLSGDNWISIDPLVRDARQPEILDPNLQEDWTIHKVVNFASRGLYPIEQMQNFQSLMTNSFSRKAV